MPKLLVPVLLLVAGCAAAPGGAAELPACEWCGADEAPDELTSEMVLAGPDEPGERLVVEGTVFQADGVTPAPGVLLYAYHTDATGRYSRRGDETGNGRRHGRLRGWLVTDDRGRYRIDTVRPAGYPGSDEPAHVHVTLRPPGGEEIWIDSIEFADDPRLTAAQRARREGRGGPGIVDPARGEDGVWRATRDVVLPAAAP
ncbi:MAG TPA: intradiol ring-cleavage dioxygenase [Thermoanaerobaculia bacterium]|nr:intradiol ring-cleavage dioxygenase [Thermoanaerobaculia bacterium]